jgi:hypothetical protein
MANCSWSQPPKSPAEKAAPDSPPPKKELESPSADTPTKQPSPAQTKPRVVEYAEGVRIDWSIPAVVLEAMVILREGALELFACRPGIREHESILAVRGKAIDIFNAVGLIGVKPGHPIRYDLEERKVIPPAGERVIIEIIYQHGHDQKTVSIESWLRDVETKDVPDPQKWLFTGSFEIDDHARLAAEYEGTIISVVDFDTALFGPADLHSADNEALWIEAFTERIPPRGTSCLIRIKPAASRSKTSSKGIDIDKENEKKNPPKVEPAAAQNHNTPHD